MIMLLYEVCIIRVKEQVSKKEQLVSMGMRTLSVEKHIHQKKSTLSILMISVSQNFLLESTICFLCQIKFGTK